MRHPFKTKTYVNTFCSILVNMLTLGTSHGKLFKVILENNQICLKMFYMQMKFTPDLKIGYLFKMTMQGNINRCLFYSDGISSSDYITLSNLFIFIFLSSLLPWKQN